MRAHLHPIVQEAIDKDADVLFSGENTGINFDAYDDIPVEVRAPAFPCSRILLWRVLRGLPSGRPAPSAPLPLCVSQAGTRPPAPTALPSPGPREQATGSDVPEPIKSFDEIQMNPALLENVRRCKYSKPTPVQRYSIPIGLAGRDMMACAQTGSGKTAAFCFPIIGKILQGGESFLYFCLALFTCTLAL